MKILITCVVTLLIGGCKSMLMPYHHYEGQQKMDQSQLVTFVGDHVQDYDSAFYDNASKAMGQTIDSISSAYLVSIDGHRRVDRGVKIDSFNDASGSFKVYAQAGLHELKLSSKTIKADSGFSSTSDIKLKFSKGNVYQLLVGKTVSNCTYKENYNSTTKSCSWDWVPIIVDSKNGKAYVFKNKKPTAFKI